MNQAPNRRPMARGRRVLFSVSFELVEVRSPNSRQPVVLIGHLSALPFRFRKDGIPVLRHRPLKMMATDGSTMSRQPLRGGFADLDIAEPPRLPEEGGDAKKALVLSVRHQRSPTFSAMLFCPSPEPAPNQPPALIAGQEVVLIRTARGHKLVSRTVGND